MPCKEFYSQSTKLWSKKKLCPFCEGKFCSLLMMLFVQIILIASGLYIGCGLLFAVAFVTVGAKSVDSGAEGGSWGFRLIILPGAMALWPLLLYRWIRQTHQPPTERTAHRQPANEEGRV
jgi:hypothetical protein